MGINLFGSSCSCGNKYRFLDDTTYNNNKFPNPDPSNFKITYIKEIDDYTIVEVEYPDCTNYEGKKILVYKAKKKDILKEKKLDPHFCDGEHLFPIARFIPTVEGMDMAHKFVYSLNKSK